MHAVESIVPNAFAPSNVNDFALIQIEANRADRNTLRIPDRRPLIIELRNCYPRKKRSGNEDWISD
jgi:hypothetical protein